MSPVQDLDLGALARPEESRSEIRAPRRRGLYLLVPLGLLIGFGLVFSDGIRDLLETPQSVTVIRPAPTEQGAVAAGAVVLTAAGWVEPDPYPLRVTALAAGVIKEMLVDESDAVQVDQPIARLIDDDVKLEVARREAELAVAKAELEDRRVALRAATEAFDAAIEVTEARDSARARKAGREAELERHRQAALEAKAGVEVAQAELETQRFLREQKAAGPWQVELAAAKHSEAKARYLNLLAEIEVVTASVAEASAQVVAMDTDFELRIDERRRVDAAKAAVSRAVAQRDAAQVQLAEALLRSKRMVVVSPAAGVVLERKLMPGSVAGVGAGAEPLVTLYDPARLRIRVDVPQGQVAKTSVGMPVEIRCDVRRGKPYRGEVARIIDVADIQKTTLEVQVRVLDPDALLKPDMLCQVSVLGAPDSTERPQASVAVRIPARCVEGGRVWVLDPQSGRAALRQVEVGSTMGDDLIITAGLNLSDKVIDQGRRGLEEGSRVAVEESP